MNEIIEHYEILVFFFVTFLLPMAITAGFIYYDKKRTKKS